MRLPTILAAILLIAAPMAAPAAALPTVKTGTPYASARTALSRQGYRPVRGNGSGCRFGREDVCRAYPEAETCAGTGLGNCLFLWRRGGQLIEVTTVGEEPRRLAVSRLRCRSGCG